MNQTWPEKPVVLVIAGHDPSGGAGIQADIESVASAGCHAVTIITSLTAQNTAGVADVVHQEASRLEQQLHHLLDDIRVQSCKVGLVASIEHVHVIEKLIRSRLQQVPLVVDPVITAGSGHVFIEQDIRTALFEHLLPPAAIITPNSIEARTLSGCEDSAAAGKLLLANGSGSVLITGSHEETDSIINTLYRHGQDPKQYTWERLPGTFHGSGCTLSSAIAGRLARGEDMESAIRWAQDYTWQALRAGREYGQAQIHPDRFFWASVGQD